MTATEYINTAISKNIIRAINGIENSGKYALTLWYSEEDIASAIQQFLNNISQNFLYNILKANGIPNTFKQNKICTAFSEDDTEIIKKALENIGLLLSIPEPSGQEKTVQILSHPDMLYYYATMQLNLLSNNDINLSNNDINFQQLGIKDKPSFINCIDKQIRNRLIKIFAL